MVLNIHSNTSYHSEPKARSRAGGNYFCSNNSEIPPNNGAVLNIAQIIKAVISSAAEAELGALFHNAQVAEPIRVCLEEMGHPQSQPTPITTDNNTDHGLTMGTMASKALKSNDMRFQWL